MNENLTRRAMFGASASVAVVALSGAAIAYPTVGAGRREWDTTVTRYRAASVAYRAAQDAANALPAPVITPMRSPIGPLPLQVDVDLTELRAILMQDNHFCYLGDGPAKVAAVDEEVAKVAAWKSRADVALAPTRAAFDAVMAACDTESEAASKLFEMPAPDLAAVIEKIGLAISEGYDIDEMVVVEADLRRLGSN